MVFCRDAQAMMAVIAAAPRALADQLPVGGPIAHTAIAAAIDEGLQAIEGVAILRHPIGLDAPRDPRQEMTGQVRNLDPGQDEKSGVVRHIGQVALTHRRRQPIQASRAPHFQAAAPNSRQASGRPSRLWTRYFRFSPAVFRESQIVIARTAGNETAGPARWR